MAHSKGMSASASMFSRLPLTVVEIIQASLRGTMWPGLYRPACGAQRDGGFGGKRNGHTQRSEGGFGGSGTGAPKLMNGLGASGTRPPNFIIKGAAQPRRFVRPRYSAGGNAS